ncbi:lipid-binding SYLF domain-containing protein [Salegentibacter sp. HM20]
MKTKLMMLLFGLFAVYNLNAQTAEQQELIDDAEKAKAAFMAENAETGNLFDEAAGYVIFPNVGKGAYILGGAAGNGVVYQNGELIGFAELRQLDIGFQLGGQAFRQAILFETQAELDEFKEGSYKLAGNASAVVIEKGKAKSLEFKDGRAIITMPKAGAMIEASVGGQRFDYQDMQ